MQSKEIVSKPLDTEWAVVKWDVDVRKDVKASGLVHPSLLEKGVLVSTDRYVVKKNIRSFNPTDDLFERQTGNGGFGYLVGSQPAEHLGKTVYRVVPASDFITAWAEQAEAVRQLEEQERIAQEAQEKRQAELERKAEARAQSKKSAEMVAVERSTKARKAIETFLERTLCAETRADADAVGVHVYGDTNETVEGKFEGFVGGYISMKVETFQEFMQVFMDLQEQVKSRG